MKNYKLSNAGQVRHFTRKRDYRGISASDALTEKSSPSIKTESLKSKRPDENDSVTTALIRWEGEGGACPWCRP